MSYPVTLRCDSCNWEKPVAFDASLIGTPCPDCGANTLAEEDYKLAVAALGVSLALGAKIVEKGKGNLTVNPHSGEINVRFRLSPDNGGDGT